MSTARQLTEPAPIVPTATAPLLGRRILLVEDEALVAIDLEMTLEAAGAEVIGPCLRLSQAAAAIERAMPDAAILDMVLGRRDSTSLATVLSDRGVPIVMHSGHAGAAAVAARHRGARVCPKPCSPATIVRAVAAVIVG